MRLNLETILATSGDLAIKTVTPSPVALVHSSGEYNLDAGQIGFFDARTRLSLDATSIVNSGKVIVAVGQGGGSSNRSTSVKYASAGEFTACEISSATSEPYRAGTTETVDFLFKCTDCALDYTLKVGINNPDLNMYFPGNSQHFETFTVQSEDCPSCGDDCDYTHDCAETLTKLVTAINANTQVMQYMTSVAAIASDDAVFDTYTTYTCGIRFTTKLAARECGCFPPAEHSIHKFVKPTIKLGTGFTSANSVIIYGTAAVIEEGNGDALLWREFRSERTPGNRSVTTTEHPYYAQRKDSRTKNLTVDCEEDYCLITLVQRMNDTGNDATELPFKTNMQTVIAIPTGDTTTTASVIGILNAWFNSKPCGPTVTLSCANDFSAGAATVGDITTP